MEKEGPFLCAFSFCVLTCSVSLIMFSTEFFQFHINLFHFRFVMLLVFRREKDIWPNEEQEGSLCSSARSHAGRAKPPLYCCVSDKRTLGGAVGPVPAAQLVTPDQAQQLPW